MNETKQAVEEVSIEEIPMASALGEELVIDQLLEHYVAEMRASGELESRWLVEPRTG